MQVRYLLLILCFTTTVFGQTVGCHDDAPVGWVPRELLERSIELREGIGSVTEKVTTTSAEAQRFYDQGLAYLHSYVWVEAARSFHQALRHDPKLAMAYVGLSRAYSGFWDTEAAAAMAERAITLSAGASEREKRHIELRKLRVEAIRDFKNAEKLASYKQMLEQALARHFEDLELWLLRGNVEDRFGAAGIGQYGSTASIPYYEHVLAHNSSHFAADHFLVHSYEHAGRIDDALKHGEKYAAAAPSVPHAHHMYGHDLRRVGRTREAIEQFEAADRLEVAYFQREKIEPHMDWHHPHNLDLLATSFQHQGQMKKAEEVMRRSYLIPAVTELRAVNKKEWPGFLLARDRVDEAAMAAREMIGSSYPNARATGHIFAGHIALLRNSVGEAREHLEAATLETAKSKGPLGEMMRTGLQPYLEKLRGAILLRSGERAQARELLKKVQAGLRAIPGPDAWMQALFELESIARIAREAGDWELVEYTARQMLEHDSAYGGSHYLLGQVAERKGARGVAEQHFAEAKKLWSFADEDLPELQRESPRRAATR
jgi:tetratricopeptide (TPR) repeat protein